MIKLTTPGVCLFHSILQLIKTPSSEYSDHPIIGINAQNNPITQDNIIAFIATSFFLASLELSGFLILKYLILEINVRM